MLYLVQSLQLYELQSHMTAAMMPILVYPVEICFFVGISKVSNPARKK